jgi:EAL domain-containing protein (putative c-di-GMP-specific phosphodiesterase class I)
VQIIKIDRSFVRDLQIDEEDAAIVNALVGLGNALRIEVVAEGIETADQHDFLRALGCTVGQGYHFSAAVSAGSVSDLFLRRPGSQARVAA